MVYRGDFNLLPPNFDFIHTYETHQEFYAPKSEIEFYLIRSNQQFLLEAMAGKDKELYYTHIANDPDAKGKADRTIDYIFHSNGIQTKSYYVRQKDTAAISDHLLIVDFQIPE